jgi:integrase
LHKNAIAGYVANVSMMSQSTAEEYGYRLNSFKSFIQSKYKVSIDRLIQQINDAIVDPYHILFQYADYLKKYNNISNLTLKQRVVTVKNFLEYHDVDISPRKFKLKLKLPRVVRKNKEALTKQDIVNILNACSNIRLKTYVMLLATTGMRAVEALSIRVKDVDLQSNPPRVFVRGEFTKTGSDRTMFLTSELGNQLSSWLDYKYRTRRVCYSNKNGKTITEYRTPERNVADLIFSAHNLNPDPNHLYANLRGVFAKTLDRMGKGAREEGNEKRREITLHSFRRFVKTTISDLGYQDFSEYFIGHSGSSYWTKKESDKAEIFRKVEPYLTFLDYEELERKGADIASQLEEKDRMIQNMMRKQEQFEQLIQSLIDSGQLKPAEIRM